MCCVLCSLLSGTYALIYCRRFRDSDFRTESNNGCISMSHDSGRTLTVTWSGTIDMSWVWGRGPMAVGNLACHCCCTWVT